MERTRTDCDVLIVGGGPTGVALALFCLARGITAEVYERSATVYPLPRAVVMDDEIQRAFAAVDIDLESITTKMRGAEFLNRHGERVIGLELPEEGNWAYGFYPVVCFHQPTLETTLRSILLERGGVLQREHTIVEVQQFDDHVVASIQAPDGSVFQRSCRWLVAADGASSPLRKSVGIQLTDLEFDEEWVVVDVRVRDDVRLPLLTQQCCGPDRIVTVVPGHADWRRWEFRVNPGELGREIAEPARLAELLQPWISEAEGIVERSAVYRFHATVADNMRAGNIFLAGDSAHQMPPFLGQGMCSGIRDAVNLAWKFAAVTNEHVSEALLDSYDAERRPHATGVVHHAVDTGMLMNRIASEDKANDTSAGYGGGRPFPILVGGFLGEGHFAVGRQLPNPKMSNGQRVDSVLGRNGTLITAPENVFAAESLLADSPASQLTVKVVGFEPSLFNGLLTNTNVIFVRPDFTIASVSELADESIAETPFAFTKQWLA